MCLFQKSYTPPTFTSLFILCPYLKWYIVLLLGKYGLGCGSDCKCIHGSCDPVSGYCACNSGFTNASCSVPCKVSVIFKIGPFSVMVRASASEAGDRAFDLGPRQNKNVKLGPEPGRG